MVVARGELLLWPLLFVSDGVKLILQADLHLSGSSNPLVFASYMAGLKVQLTVKILFNGNLNVSTVVSEEYKMISRNLILNIILKLFLKSLVNK